MLSNFSRLTFVKANSAGFSRLQVKRFSSEASLSDKTVQSPPIADQKSPPPPPPIPAHPNQKLSQKIEPMATVFDKPPVIKTSRDPSIKYPRRVLFNVPGDDERKMRKALGLNLDTLILDLEDGVAQNRKSIAREVTTNFLLSAELQTALRNSNTEKCVRVNPFASEFGYDDLRSLAKAIPMIDSIVIPKVNSPEDIGIVADFLHMSYRFLGSHIRFLAFIETAKGLLHLRDICEKSPRLSAIIIGSEDLCADMGMTRSKDRKELLFARSNLVLHAKAYGIDAIDIVCVDYKNEAALREEAEEGARMGFDGKQAIHPAQIAPIYDSFLPSKSHVEWAEKILSENLKHQAEGKGAFSLEGKMIDMPMVKWAEGIVQRINLHSSSASSSSSSSSSSKQEK